MRYCPTCWMLIKELNFVTSKKEEKENIGKTKLANLVRNKVILNPVKDTRQRSSLMPLENLSLPTIVQKTVEKQISKDAKDGDDHAERGNQRLLQVVLAL